MRKIRLVTLILYTRQFGWVVFYTCKWRYMERSRLRLPKIILYIRDWSWKHLFIPAHFAKNVHRMNQSFSTVTFRYAEDLQLGTDILWESCMGFWMSPNSHDLSKSYWSLCQLYLPFPRFSSILNVQRAMIIPVQYCFWTLLRSTCVNAKNHNFKSISHSYYY